MAMQPASIGEMIAQNRVRQGLTVAEFCAAVGLSRATYSRVIRGRATLSLEQLYAALSVLAIEPSDFMAVLQTGSLWVERLKTTVLSHLPCLAAAPAQASWLADISNTLAEKAALTGNVGVRQLLAYVRAGAATAAKDEALAAQLAQALGAELVAYPSWTAFEMDLFLAIGAALPWASCERVLTHILVGNRQTGYRGAPPYARALDLRVRAFSELFLTRACQTGSARALQLAADWVADQQVDTANLPMQAWVNLGQAVLAHLAGDLTVATRYAAQVAARDLVWGGAAAFANLDALWSTIAARTWDAVPALPQPVPPAGIAPAGRATTLVAQLAAYRRAKGVTVAAAAKWCGVSRATYQRFEHGRGPVSSDVFINALNALRLQRDDLQTSLFNHTVPLLADEFRLATHMRPANLAELLAMQGEFAAKSAAQATSPYRYLAWFCAGMAARHQGQGVTFTACADRMAKAALATPGGGLSAFERRWLNLAAGGMSAAALVGLIAQLTAWPKALTTSEWGSLAVWRVNLALAPTATKALLSQAETALAALDPAACPNLIYGAAALLPCVATWRSGDQAAASAQYAAAKAAMLTVWGADFAVVGTFFESAWARVTRA
ncbi:helix-turn-helix transcriptional regulator [Lacticaseibacillus parakribbianus]|uniref:helix-turn-helix transcriptional regulator n=1 Tax=Lacticaseibacillus parakribbianus TaxID=2970927 RepID=UPI0021CB2304|nr:helix-turn-helix transcriptional regulator [Lacticaseibacillus parakribbianus]